MTTEPDAGGPAVVAGYRDADYMASATPRSTRRPRYWGVNRRGESASGVGGCGGWETGTTRKVRDVRSATPPGARSPAVAGPRSASVGCRRARVQAGRPPGTAHVRCAVAFRRASAAASSPVEQLGQPECGTQRSKSPSCNRHMSATSPTEFRSGKLMIARQKGGKRVGLPTLAQTTS